ncbi:MAG: transposase [Eubacteriaceae bacterium]|nr:transposase [Eubacteriaceae bacterium]
MTKFELIKELTLALLYLTSTEEDENGTAVKKSWKGYPFEALDELTEDELISWKKSSKAVYLTEDGAKKAEEIVKKLNLK